MAKNDWEVVSETPAATAEPSAAAEWDVVSEQPLTSASTPAEKEPKKEETGFFNELRKGVANAIEYGFPTMAKQIQLQGNAGSMVERQKQIDLMKRIDNGDFKSVGQLKNDPTYEAIRSSGGDVATVNAYFANRKQPEVAQKIQGATEKGLQEVATSTTKQIDILNRYAKESKEKYGAAVDKFTDINWSDPSVVSDFTKWFGYNFGAGAVNLVPVMLASVVFKQPGLLAASGAMGVSEAVGNRLKYVQKQTKDLPPEARGQAIAEYIYSTRDTNMITGLISGSFDLLLGPAASAAKANMRQLVGEMGKAAAVKKAAKELPKDIGSEFVTGSLQEGTQIGAKKSLGEEGKQFTLENAKEMFNAGMSEAAGAGAGTAVNVGRAAMARRPKEQAPELTGESTDFDWTVVSQTPDEWAQVKEIAARLEAQGFPSAEAKKIAMARVASARSTETKNTEAPTDTTTTESTDEPTGETTAPPTGTVPTRRAGKLMFDDPFDDPFDWSLNSDASDKGETSATETDTDSTGASTGVPSQSANNTASTEGTQATERTGVVSTGQDADGSAAREGEKPAPVAYTVNTRKEGPSPVVVTRKADGSANIDYLGASYYFNEPTASNEDLIKRITVGDGLISVEPVIPEGKSLGTQTTETQQAETQGQEAPGTTSKTVTPESQVSEDEIAESLATPTELVDDSVDGTVPLTEAETMAAPTEVEEVGAGAATGEPPKKRGRPATLTAEEKAAREATAKEDRKVRERHRRALGKLIPALKKATTALNEDNFADEAELKEAQDAQRSERRAAVRELLKIADEAGPKPAGKQARAALKEAGITDREIADIRRGIEVAKKALESGKEGLLGPVADSATAKANVDPAFSAMTKGSQVISHIIRTGNAFQRLFAQRIRNFVNNVRIVVIEKGDELPDQLKKPKNAEHWDKSRALYIENFDTGDRVVYVRGASFGAAQGVNNVTMLHELWHAATVKKIAIAQMLINKGINTDSALVKAYNTMLRTMHAAQERFFELNDDGMLPPEMVTLISSTEASIITDPREFVSYGMTDRDFQEFLLLGEGQINKPSLMTPFVDSLRRMFGMPPNSMTALQDLLIASDVLLNSKIPTSAKLDGEATAEQKIESSKKAERTAIELEADVAAAKKKVEQSRLGSEELGFAMKALQAARSPTKALEILKGLWNGATYKQRQLMVRLPTMDVLAQWANDAGIPRITNVHKHLQEMNGMSLKFLDGANQVIQATRRALNKNPQERKKVEDLVYAATLAEYDPANLNNTTRSPTLDADFDALSPDSQQAYVRLRDYYEDVHSLFRALLDAQVESLADVSAEVKQNLMVLIRQTFETDSPIQPFFPLVRRGDFWVSVGRGENRQFFMFEKMGERDAFAKQLGRTVKGEVKTGNDMSELRRSTQDASGLLKAFFDVVDSTFAKQQNNSETDTAAAKDALKDAVYQIYLQTMPEQSFRKMFIHRKGVTGFSTDLIRNTATTASRMATQLARLKYSPILRNDLSAARSSIEGRPELTPFVQEAQLRVNSAISGQPGGISAAIAGVANKASYIWYMSSAASALIQPFSVYISGLPVLAANHGGNWYGAARELGRMMTHLTQYGITRENVDGTTSYTSPTLANNTALPADERAAVKAMMERGVQESTYASQVWGYSRVPSANIDSISGKGKRAADLLIGGLMHSTESLTREMVYLASYRLGKKRGLSTEEAINQAVADTNEALSDYDVSNRPRYMQKGLGKIAFQFKMYPLHMTLLALTSFKKMLPFLNKEGKLAAAQKFFGLMGTSATLAGAANMLFFSPIMALLGWAWKQMGDDDELPEELKDKNFETWFRSVFLPEKLGQPWADIVDRGFLNYLTGLDIGSRTGLNDLWGRDSKETKTARDSAIAFVVDNFGGPTASLGLSMADAYEAFMLGDYQKAMEKMSPALIRNVLIANKYANEGIKTARGSELVPKEAVTNGEKFGQLIGFRPDRAAFAQQQAFKATGIEQKIANEREFLMRKLNTAHRLENDDNFDKTLDQIVKFNNKNPEFKIEGEDIKRSLKEQTKKRESAEAGVNLTKKNTRLLGDMVDNASRVLEKNAEPPKK